MEIREDEYVPEREFSTNFRIPRKRPYEFSNSGQGYNNYGDDFTRRKPASISDDDNNYDREFNQQGPRYSNQGSAYNRQEQGYNKYEGSATEYLPKDYTRRGNYKNFLQDQGTSHQVMAGAYNDTSNANIDYFRRYRRGGNDESTTNSSLNLDRPMLGYPDLSKYNPTTHLSQKILEDFQRRKEKPKSYEPTNLMKHIAPDVEDITLPKELVAMFQPLYCKLCVAQLSSNVMAKTHYRSTKHDKKLRKWLTEYSETKKVPLHKRAKIVLSAKISEEERDPKWFHCDVCDLPMTGKLHAESHYMGRNHTNAVLGKKNPTGKGYYDAQGKWVRQKTEIKGMEIEDDTFGASFRIVKSDADSSIAAPPPPAIPANPTAVRCDFCEITCTNLQQLDQHNQGQKHLKMIRNFDYTKVSDKEAEKYEIFPLPPPISGGDLNLTGDLANVSNHRTPSGAFYCKTCDLTVNSKIQLDQHLESKKHKSKLAAKDDAPKV